MKLSNIHLTLAHVRKEHNLSQQTIAELLNIEQATVSLYETGKRGIPLDLLDDWFKILCIDVSITPKGCVPAKPIEEVHDALKNFEQLKKRRNFLIAELRAIMAEKIMQDSELQKTDEETGENRFWPYSFPGDSNVGLVETRYDHPEHKYLAVEYTKDEVNVYKFLAAHESGDGEGDHDRLNINRVYFSEDDFLTLGEFWNQNSMEKRKMTILRRNIRRPGAIEIIDPEGFSLQSLLDMQENYIRFSAVIEEVKKNPSYKKLEAELDTIIKEMVNLSMTSRFENGSANPDFVFWAETDHSAVDVPLWSTQRIWSWIDEGVEWTENTQSI